MTTGIDWAALYQDLHPDAVERTRAALDASCAMVVDHGEAPAAGRHRPPPG